MQNFVERTGTTTPSLRKKLVRVFSPPLTSSFVAAFAALKVSLWRRMSAVATGIFILTGTTTPSLRKKLVRVFSPPLTSSFVAAFAALKVSLWRRMSAVATGSLILTKRQHPHFA